MINVNGNRLTILSAIVGVLLLGDFQVTAQEQSRPNLNGIWNGTVTSIEHPLWMVEELFQCNCTPEAYEYLNELLYNPEFDHMSAEDIIDEVARFNEEQIATMYTDAGRAYAEAFDHADDPAIQCEYFGAFRTILHNDPILIEDLEIGEASSDPRQLSAVGDLVFFGVRFRTRLHEPETHERGHVHGQEPGAQQEDGHHHRQ